MTPAAPPPAEPSLQERLPECVREGYQLQAEHDTWAKRPLRAWPCPACAALKSVRKADEAAARLDADAKRIAELERDLSAANRSLDWCGDQLKACAQYVKDGETVPQAMERNWTDSQNALGLFAKERIAKEKAERELAEARAVHLADLDRFEARLKAALKEG